MYCRGWIYNRIYNSKVHQLPHKLALVRIFWIINTERALARKVEITGME